MPAVIRYYENKNQPILPGKRAPVPRTYFNLIRLSEKESYSYCLQGFESVAVVLSGTVHIHAGSVQFEYVGRRKDIWEGPADSVYAPPDTEVRILCLNGEAEIAVAGGAWPPKGGVRSPRRSGAGLTRGKGQTDQRFEPFRISPEEVVPVDVGSLETHSRRRICHILGKHTEGRSGNLLVSELYAEPGCWSGYPPHKHDEDAGTEESRFEEVYHFRYHPTSGFGVQLVFQPDGTEKVYRTQHGDTVLIDKGYHPTATSPGHRGYIFTILVGISTRSLVQNFKEEYRYLMHQIPGIRDMVNAFK